jgi:hypothetical protein
MVTDPASLAGDYLTRPDSLYWHYSPLANSSVAWGDDLASIQGSRRAQNSHAGLRRHKK